MIIIIGLVCVFYLTVFGFLYGWSLNIENVFVAILTWLGWLLLFPCVVAQFIIWSN